MTTLSSNTLLAKNTTLSSYALLDSGEGRKLERIGDKILVRPTRFAIWTPRFPERWRTADAEFLPKGGWKYGKKNQFSEWTVQEKDFSYRLRLQKNGQIGVFPEHSTYFSWIQETLSTFQSPKVLNLFAYTGLASLVAAQQGASVTHIDLSKQVLTWAKENVGLNPSLEGKVRFIPEDAVLFVEREAKRGNKYEMIIADPPSFSRPQEGDEWVSEEILEELLKKIRTILAPHGALVLTSHRYELGSEVLHNLCVDTFADKQVHTQYGTLSIPEENSPRVLPAGYFLLLKLQ